MQIIPATGASLHKVLLRSVMGAPQSFFDETDSGVTLNRFSQDMTLIDGQLPISLVLTLTCKCSFAYLVHRLELICKTSCNAMPSVNCIDRSRIKLHGDHMPCYSSSNLCMYLPHAKPFLL